MIILQENQAELAGGISHWLLNDVNAFAATQGASQIADSMTTALFSWQPLINKHSTLTHGLASPSCSTGPADISEREETQRRLGLLCKVESEESNPFP